MTEHRSPDPPLLHGLQGGGDGPGVDLGRVAPRRGGLGDVADHAVVQHEIADVGGVVLLLVVEGARSLADPQPAVGTHDLADEPLLVGDVVRRPLETDEGHGDLLQVPSLGQHELLDALAEQRRQLRGAFPVGHDVLRLDGVRDTGHHDGGVGGDDLLARLQPVLVGGEEVGLDLPHLRDAVHVHPRRGDDSQAPLRSQHHLTHARAGRRRRQRPQRQDLAGHHHAQAAADVGDVAVLVGLHAGAAGRDPPAQCRPHERVGLVSHRPAARLELFLHVGAEHARLDVCQPGLFVDGEHPVHPPQVHRDHLPLLAGFGLQGGDDVGAPAERDHHRVGRHRHVDDPRHLVLVGGIDHHVGQPAELAGAHPHQVAHPLPEAVDDAGLVIGLHVLGAGDPDQGITQFRFQARCRNLQVRELRHRGDRLVDVDADQFLHEGGELRFVVVVV